MSDGMQKGRRLSHMYFHCVAAFAVSNGIVSVVLEWFHSRQSVCGCSRGLCAALVGVAVLLTYCITMSTA